MAEAKVVLTAEDRASTVIDNVTKRLGIFNKEGIAMGIAFAAMNAGINFAVQKLNDFRQWIVDGVEKNREFEMSLTRISIASKDLNVDLGTMGNTLKSFSVLFATDVNILAKQTEMFLREGFTAKQAMNMVFQAGRFAVATNSDIADTQAAVNTAMDVFNLTAGNTTEIMDGLNSIMGNTSMTVDQVNNVMGRTAMNTQEAGINFNDFVNIIYTLEEKGVAPRNMIIEINKALEDLSNFSITAMPEGAVTSIADRYREIMETGTMTIEMVKQLKTLQQMNLTGGLDIGKAIDKSIVEEAKKIYEGGLSVSQLVGQSGGALGLMFRSRVNIINQLVEAYRILDEMETESAGITDDFATRLQNINSILSNLSDNVDKYSDSLEEYWKDYSRSTIQKQFTMDMREATLAVQEQEDAIKNLQRAADRYSFEQFSNNLEIMKIQYSAGRRGLSRGQQRQVELIEHENMGLRIKEMEQQQAIQSIQMNGLQQAQDHLDSIRREHDAIMYQQEIEDLSVHINTVYNMWMDMYERLARERQKLNRATYEAVGNVAPYSTSGNVTGPAWTGSFPDFYAQLSARAASQKLLRAKLR